MALITTANQERVFSSLYNMGAHNPIRCKWFRDHADDLDMDIIGPALPFLKYAVRFTSQSIVEETRTGKQDLQVEHVRTFVLD